MRQVPKKHSVDLFRNAKQQQQRISMVTCYDYSSAKIIADTAIDCVLVGDSVAMMMHGFDSTIHADMPMMELHTRAVARGIGHQFVISDLPFLEHRKGLAHLTEQAQRLMRAGAQAVKIEGGDSACCQAVAHLSQAGVPVVGHIGLMPQSVHAIGGHKVQGRKKTQADKLMAQAAALDQAGCIGIVLECVPHTLAKTISESVDSATIGIGAGPDTNGQVLVWHDLLGLQDALQAKFIERFLQGKSLSVEALERYHQAVCHKHFPDMSHCYFTE